MEKPWRSDEGYDAPWISHLAIGGLEHWVRDSEHKSYVFKPRARGVICRASTGIGPPLTGTAAGRGTVPGRRSWPGCGPVRPGGGEA